MHFGSFRYQPGQLGSADLVPIFFVIVSLYPHGKTVLLKSQFLLPQSGTFFRPEGKMATLSCCNWQPPAISHGFTLSYLKVLFIELVVFTAHIKLHELAERYHRHARLNFKWHPLGFLFCVSH